MTRTILAFDEADATLGVFFTACHTELNTFLSGKGIEFGHLNSARLNDLAVTQITANNPYFIFGAFSHGNHDSLLKSARDPYVTNALNGDSFKNSFFYTFSCSSGKTLGRDLVAERQCLCFIGYKEAVAIWSTYIQPFVECANFGLIQFINGADSETVIKNMIEKYNEHIDTVYKKDFLIAAILKENRDALVRHGSVITINDLRAA